MVEKEAREEGGEGGQREWVDGLASGERKKQCKQELTTHTPHTSTHGKIVVICDFCFPSVLAACGQLVQESKQASKPACNGRMSNREHLE